MPFQASVTTRFNFRKSSTRDYTGYLRNRLARRGVNPGPRAARYSLLIGGETLSEDKTKTDGQDRSRIAMGEDYEVAHWTKKFGVGRDELANAVSAVGNSAQAVADFLGKWI